MGNYKVKTVPYKHQIEAFKKGHDKEFFAYFMEQGTGKSKAAIDDACNLFLDGKIEAVMLIAPKGVHRQWDDEQLPAHCSVPYSRS